MYVCHVHFRYQSCNPICESDQYSANTCSVNDELFDFTFNDFPDLNVFEAKEGLIYYLSFHRNNVKVIHRIVVEDACLVNRPNLVRSGRL